MPTIPSCDIPEARAVAAAVYAEKKAADAILAFLNTMEQKKRPPRGDWEKANNALYDAKKALAAHPQFRALLTNDQTPDELIVELFGARGSGRVPM